MIPVIDSALYRYLVNEMINLPYRSPERERLAVLQKQLAEAQQSMLRDKTLDVWQKAS